MINRELHKLLDLGIMPRPRCKIPLDSFGLKVYRHGAWRSSETWCVHQSWAS